METARKFQTEAASGPSCQSRPSLATSWWGCWGRGVGTRRWGRGGGDEELGPRTGPGCQGARCLLCTAGVEAATHTAAPNPQIQQRSHGDGDRREGRAPGSHRPRGHVGSGEPCKCLLTDNRGAVPRPPHEPQQIALGWRDPPTLVPFPLPARARPRRA
jgi:hypothetical protein